MGSTDEQSNKAQQEKEKTVGVNSRKQLEKEKQKEQQKTVGGERSKKISQKPWQNTRSQEPQRQRPPKEGLR